MSFLKSIQNSLRENRVIYSSHAREEMLNEPFGRIYDKEIEGAIINGKIIEQYPKDRPYPSCLISGSTKAERVLHIVVAHNSADNISIVITAYQPNPEFWSQDYSRRKK